MHLTRNSCAIVLQVILVVMAGKEMKTTLLLLVVLITGWASRSTRPPGICQFVETRAGRLSVWGVDVQLERLSFQPEISDDQIVIREGKYGRDLRGIMEWSVSDDRKRLRIRFRPGMGGFGSGNGVTVHVDKSAIVKYCGPNNRLEWEIQTDIQ